MIEHLKFSWFLCGVAFGGCHSGLRRFFAGRRLFLCCRFVKKCYKSCILKVNSPTLTNAHWESKQNKEKSELLRNWRTQEMGVLFSWRSIT